MTALNFFATALTSSSNFNASMTAANPFRNLRNVSNTTSHGFRNLRKAHASAVEQALDDMLREEQELVNELGFRHTAITEWTDAHQGIADALTGLFRLAGRKDLAERVRPTSRSLAGEETPEDTTTTGNESSGKSEG